MVGRLGRTRAVLQVFFALAHTTHTAWSAALFSGTFEIAGSEEYQTKSKYP
jgi:hypothetical protein